MDVADDVVVTSAGNVGIGTNSPQTKVDIRSTTQGKGFRLQDGSQGNGKVLTTDGNGNGSWKTPGVAYAKLGTIPANPVTNPVLDATSDSEHIAYSGMSIELTPGDYQVNFTAWISPQGDNVAATLANNRFASIFFSTSSTANIPPTYLSPIKSVIIQKLYSEGSIHPDYYGSGAIPIKITTTTTLYLWAYVSATNWNGDNKLITSYNGLAGSYGPYTQLYAVPFYIE
ncbi:hypothetical protein [Dysgonomonas sp. 520]|uniref:hypothetical protein n=1 Tax=Dysgonomonas sp. 520 TaxID=2302931 RepID=UPI0013D79287|nr:hypothetical protein [Dysgonomonas sp. 520]NDW08900.1 hypothetical protein [Dysgonomonas sp. 520]